MPISKMPMLPPRFHDVLKAISDYIDEFGKSPYGKNGWISEKTGYGSNHITQIKGDLLDMQFLTADAYLTAKGKEYIRLYFDPFVVKSIEVRVQGTATAGPTDVDVEIEDLLAPSSRIIEIPPISSKDVFAVAVQGISMEKEGILNGDFVIVERQDSLWWPSPQDMIVASYLPASANYGKTSQISPTDFVGPVLKVYIRRVGENGCELG